MAGASAAIKRYRILWVDLGSLRPKNSDLMAAGGALCCFASLLKCCFFVSACLGIT